MQGFSAMNATTKMMLTLVAMCLLMAAPAMGARNLLGAPHMSMHPAPCRVHAVCVRIPVSFFAVSVCMRRGVMLLARYCRCSPSL